VDRSKKGTSGKALPKHSKVTPEQVKNFLKSTIDAMIEAGDIASSKPLQTVKPTTR
jgi:hypothetical protein